MEKTHKKGNLILFCLEWPGILGRFKWVVKQNLTPDSPEMFNMDTKNDEGLGKCISGFKKWCNFEVSSH